MRLDHQSEFFDTVMAWSLFTHMERIEWCSIYLYEMYRVLRHGGKMWCSWIRSPPNPPTAEAARTVYKEADIIRLISDVGFSIFHTEGGNTSGWTDAWHMLLEKK